KVGAVGKAGSVDAALVHAVLLLQRGEGRVHHLQVAVAVLARLYLPPAVPVTAWQSLEVNDDGVGPDVLEPHVLEVLHVVAVAVEREHQRHRSGWRRRRHVASGSSRLWRRGGTDWTWAHRRDDSRLRSEDFHQRGMAAFFIAARCPTDAERADHHVLDHDR